MSYAADALLSFKEDVRKRSFADWIEAHTTGLKPLHRYEGLLKMERDRLTFTGTDRKSGEDFQMEIYKEEFEQLFLGYDNTFSIFETRGFGLGWKPLRIIFNREGQEYTIYLIINYRYTRTDNELWMQLLKEWLGES